MKPLSAVVMPLFILFLALPGVAAPGDGTLTDLADLPIERKPPKTVIAPDHPLIILQTSNRFPDTTEDWNFETSGATDPYEAARAHGREAARVWNEVLPDDIRPYCQLQMELRLRDHEERYKRLRAMLEETEKGGVAVSLQISDPHDTFTFDPIYVDKLLEEFPCIKSIGVTESRMEHFHSFNVPRYAVFPDTLYAMDVIKLAARHGVHVSMSYQMLKWLYLTTATPNRPLLDTIQAYGEYVLPQNEHLLAQHMPRQTATWGTWLAGYVDNWGVEPQSWWYENGRMLSPGVFGKPHDDAEKFAEFDGKPLMPPLLYRAMILEGAKLGATVYQFEPFWDLFDYASSMCWREAIYPTLMEVINRKLIPTRDQVLEKTSVAYVLREARSHREFHANLRDVDWIANEGLLARAAYGVWERYLMHELIPNKDDYYYIPLLPPNTPEDLLAHFDLVITPGMCDSVASYEELLRPHASRDGEGTATITSINGHTYVMQHHENLYERQTYEIDLPRPVRGVVAAMAADALALSWPEDPGATLYRIRSMDSRVTTTNPMHMPVIGETTAPSFLITSPDPEALYTVTAETTSRETRKGTVNYLDYLVFSEKESLPATAVRVENGKVAVEDVVDPTDTRPASQVVFPTYDGVAPEHMPVATALVDRIGELKTAYDSRNHQEFMDLYSDEYLDSTGFIKPVIAHEWARWFMQHNQFGLLRQIRSWDFSEYDSNGLVHVRLFSLFMAVEGDSGSGWARYDQYRRTPRSDDEEIVYTWKRETDGVWRIVNMSPSVPMAMGRRRQ